MHVSDWTSASTLLYVKEAHIDKATGDTDAMTPRSPRYIIGAMGAQFGLLYGAGIGLLFVVVGIATYVWAPRVGPNPIFGVRTGYSYASREVWDAANRAGGAAFAALGIVMAGTSAVLWGVGLPADAVFGAATAILLVGVLSLTVWTVIYTRRLANRTALAVHLQSVRFRFSFILPTLLAFLGLCAVVVATYPSLPDRIASHFDLAGNPNGWASKTDVAALMIGLGFLFVAVDLGLVWLAAREPIVAIGRLGARWTLPPEDGLMATGWSMAGVIVVLAIVHADVVAFSLTGAHLLPMTVLMLAITIGLVAFVIGLFVWYARRSRERLQR